MTGDIILHRVFSEILTSMAEDWNDCKSEWNMEVMIQKAILSYRIGRLMFIMFTCSIVGYAMSTLFGPKDADLMSNPDEKRFLLRMAFPFEASVSPVYEIIITIQIIGQSIFCVMAGMFIALIATFVSYYCFFLFHY